LDRPPAGVAEGVAGDLARGRGEAGLVLGVEAEQRRDLPGALPGEDDVGLVEDADAEDRAGHRGPPSPDASGAGPPPPGSESRATRTVASSRPRRKSRYSTPAITGGERSGSPGWASGRVWLLSPSECMTRVDPGGKG